MSEVQRVPDQNPVPGDEALRLVLFGKPSAGKTALLSALIQSAETQQALLNGQVTDLSGRLLELGKRHRDGHLEPTAEEVILYPIRYERRAERSEAILIDCSGLIAAQILSRYQPLRGASEEGLLANSILSADAILLLVDGSAGAIELDAELVQCGHFLRLFERSRGSQIDISGLPVFLVLTKCDLLARKTDSPGEWIESIEERKLQVATRFRDFLAQDRDEDSSPFGAVELHVWATAIRRPAFSGISEKVMQPFGVAELFRQALTAAQSFRRVKRQARRKLARTVMQVVAAMTLLGAFAVLLVFGFWETAPTRLETRIERFRAQQQSLSPLAAHRTPKAKIEELQSLQSDPSFARLPEEKQKFVQNQLKELQAYQDYEQKLREITDPRDATNDSQLGEIETSLRKLKTPAEYQTEWNHTEAGRRVAEWLEDIAAIREAVQKVNNWYRKLIQDGRQVLDDLNGPNLPGRARKVLEDASMPPFPENDKDQFLPGSRRVTYDTVFRFATVAQTRHTWENEIKRRLEPYSKAGSS
jgi:GTPase SAR1 family protein